MEKDMNKMMENLSTPKIHGDSTRDVLKFTLLQSRKSAHAGIILFILPFLFFSGNVLRYNIGMELGVGDVLLDWMIALDRVPVVKWIFRFVLLGGPLIAIFINLLAITHFYHDRPNREFSITFKIRWANITIIGLSSLLLMLFFSVLVVENVNHP